MEKRIDKIEKELGEIKKSLVKEIEWTKIGDLEWSEALGEMPWDEAMAKAKELGARIPERWEMIKAVDENHDEIQKLIKGSLFSYFWSASENSTYTSVAWYVYLHNGHTNDTSKSTSCDVRCVREVK